MPASPDSPPPIPSAKSKPVSRWGRYFKITCLIVSVPFGILFLAALLGFVKIFRVPTTGMSPTLQPGELIVTTRYWGETPELQRDQLIIYEIDGVVFDRMQLHGDHIQRIVALPGDTVTVESGAIHVNGHQVERDGRISHTPIAQGSHTVFPLAVPEDHLFLMGDNYNNSLDSRYFGPVKASRVTHRPRYRIFPLGGFGKID